jgi:hypothetical protein
MICSCGSDIPQGRVDLGYRTCLRCSTTQRYACIPITNHKTGNTIQLVDQQTASAVAKASRRKGYGTCLR